MKFLILILILISISVQVIAVDILNNINLLIYNNLNYTIVATDIRQGDKGCTNYCEDIQIESCKSM